jgi:branched-chain amino acid transport system ATP-binding protein
MACAGEVNMTAGGHSLLSVAHLSKAFDGVIAVDDVSFDVAAGEMLALIGPNGAGKTTCFNVINGQFKPDAGEVRLAGVRIDGLPPRRIAALRVGRTFQTAAVFASMTVRENVQLALLAAAGEQWRITSRATMAHAAEAEALLTRVGAGILAARTCATLAYGDLKRVEIAIALAASPKLLLMDEPTAGTSASDRAELMRLTAGIIHAERIAAVFTEHDMDVVFGYADRVIVLDRGRIIAQGSPASVRTDPRVREVYLGVDSDS